MTDIVNDFFRLHYPPDYATAWETKWCARSAARSYTGEAREKRIFPEMVCADGFKMSVQGHFGAYSHPRDDFAEEYSAVEIMCRADPILDEHGGHEVGEEKVYGYVPIGTVLRVIESHGGLAESLTAAGAPQQ